MKFRFTLLVLAVVLMLAGNVRAQVTTGTISGTVKDASGAVLPGVEVVLLNEATGASRTVQTDSAGRYNAPALGLGSYKVTATVTGFQTEVRSGIELTVGRQAVVNFDLQVGTVTQTVEVTGEAPLVNTVQGSLGETMESSSITQLPLNGRDLNQLVTLQAGVVDYSNGSHDGGLLISSGGSRTRQSTVYNLDGVAIETFNGRSPAGQSKVLLGSEGIREFKVETNGFSAEYGRSSGGAINAVTKSGTNQLHGSAFEFIRNSKVDSARWEDNAFGGGQKPPFKRNQFGFSLGGPIKKDKTFFFGTYEGLRDRIGQTVTALTLSNPTRAQGLATASPAIKPYLDPNNPALWPLANGTDHGDGSADYNYTFSQPIGDNYYQARVDHQISDNDLFFGRFTALRSKMEAHEKVGVIAFPDYKYQRQTISTSMNLEEKHIFSPTLLGSFLVGFSRANAPGHYTPPEVDPSLRFVPTSDHLGALNVDILTPIGVAGQDASRPVTNGQLKGDINWTKGAHSMKFGVDWGRIWANGCNPGTDSGSYTFSTITDFFNSNVSAFTTDTAATDICRSLTQNLIGMYAQDEYRVTSRFTFSPGFRYEFITVPNEKYGRMGNFRGDLNFIQSAGPSGITLGNPFITNPSLKNFGPRVGFAWDVFGDGKTAIRGGFGLYYQEFGAPDLVQGIATSMYPFHITIAATGLSGKGFPFPNGFAICGTEADPVHPVNALCKGTAPTLQYVPYHFKNPQVTQFNVNVQHQFWSSTLLTVGYAGSHSVHQESFDQVNSPIGQNVNGRLVFDSTLTRPNANWNDLMAQDQPGWSHYNSLQVSVKQRLSHGLQATLNYAFARNTDNTSDYKDRIAYIYNPDLYRSLSQLDVRHLFSFYSTYQLPIGKGKAFLGNMGGVGDKILGGWEVNGIMTLRTGFPGDVSTAVPTFLSGIGMKVARPDLVAGANNNPISGTSAGCQISNTGVVFTGAVPAGTTISQTIAAGTPLGAPSLYLDPCSYQFSPINTMGNLGRNTVTFPGLKDVDFSLAKDFRITEGTKLQFRSEFFNLLNHPNFAAPDLRAFNAKGVPSPTFGRITSTVATARQIQFGLRLEF